MAYVPTRDSSFRQLMEKGSLNNLRDNRGDNSSATTPVAAATTSSTANLLGKHKSLDPMIFEHHHHSSSNNNLLVEPSSQVKQQQQRKPSSGSMNFTRQYVMSAKAGSNPLVSYNGSGSAHDLLLVSGASISSRPTTENTPNSRGVDRSKPPHEVKRQNFLSTSAESIEQKVTATKVLTKKKLSLKGPVQLPPWNGSTRPITPFPNPKPPTVEIAKETIETIVLVSEPRVSLGKMSVKQQPSYEEVISPKQEEVASTPDAPRFHRNYPPSPLQVEICSTLLPGSGEEKTSAFSSYFVTQCFGIPHKLDKQKTIELVNKLVSEYPVLSTQVFRNEKIIDADIKCSLDYTPWEEWPRHRFVQFKDLEVNTDPIPINVLLNQIEDWKRTKDLMSPFGVLVLDGKLSDFEQFIIFGGSLCVVDEISLGWLSKKFFSIYGSSEKSASILSDYSCEETQPFEDFSYQSVRTNSDISFWRDQCIEVSQDFVNPSEKRDLERKLNTLSKETSTLKNSLLSVTKRRAEFEKELAVLRKQRMAIDHSIHGSNESAVYITDPTTGEIVEMSLSAKLALIKTVLGEEANGENIVPLLEKHEVSTEVQRKLNAQSMSLEEFSNLSEATVDQLNLSTKDRRQVFALAEYTRNRIKECVQEQGKLKFVLERQIAKVSRGLEASIEQVTAARNTVDSNEDMSFRLTSILHPPFIEKKVDPLKISHENIAASTDSTVANCWGTVNFVVGEETLDNLRKFRSDWTNNFRNKKKRERTFDAGNSSDNESLLESDDEDENDVRKRMEKKLKEKSVDGVCLAAFGVLMKHITGTENFLVGVSSTFRTPGLIVGPLSDTLPVKLDLSKKGLSFSALFASVYKVFKHIQRHGRSCPKSFIAKRLQFQLDFPIEFQFITATEMKELTQLGMSVQDLLQPQEISNISNEPEAQRLWSMNPQDKYNIKFIMIETDSSIECAVRFRKEKFDESKILRWVAKFQSTLDGIDCSRRKLSVTAMITRYYNPLWQSVSTNDLASSESVNNLQPQSSRSSMAMFSTDMLNL